jgi:hypothetical protein
MVATLLEEYRKKSPDRDHAVIASLNRTSKNYGAARACTAKESHLNINQCVGWAMVLGTMLLLLSLGKLDLLVILLPLSLLLGYGIRYFGRNKTRLTGSLKKG